jgi:anti-sigma regulatory factor (Ser/Thr protein kinase)
MADTSSIGIPVVADSVDAACASRSIAAMGPWTERAIVYHFRDPGAGFQHADLKHATAASTPEAVLATAMHRAERGLRPGGFGMLIVREIVDEVVHNERGNEVLLIKHLV